MCLLLIFFHCQLSAQELAQVHHKGIVKGYEIGQIDSILVTQIEEEYCFQFFMKDTILAPIPIDSMTFAQQSDTVYISYTDERVTYNNPRYINAEDSIDYYTARCLGADQNILITKGTISCISRGLGGKGMVSDYGMILGEYEGVNDSLTITVLTEGGSVLNDVNEDKRNGCPKALKSGREFDVLSGNIYVKTYDMGGEGFECKDEMYVVGGNIILETYDDGINVGRSLNVLNGNLYCCSENNDGIDSNGSIIVRGGRIVSISKHEKDESFDVEQNRLCFYGGTAIGIGRDVVNVMEASIPYYTYPKYVGDWIQRPSENINLRKDTYLSIVDGGQIKYSVLIPDNMDKVYVTVASSDFIANKTYNVVESSSIEDASRELFEGRLQFGGASTNMTPLFPFNPKYR